MSSSHPQEQTWSFRSIDGAPGERRRRRRQNRQAQHQGSGNSLSTSPLPQQTESQSRPQGQASQPQPRYQNPFGTREEIDSEDYQSPLATMFGRAWTGYRNAEANRLNPSISQQPSNQQPSNPQTFGPTSVPTSLNQLNPSICQQPSNPQTFGPTSVPTSLNQLNPSISQQPSNPQPFGPQTFGPTSAPTSLNQLNPSISQQPSNSQPFGPQTFGPTSAPRSLNQFNLSISQQPSNPQTFGPTSVPTSLNRLNPSISQQPSNPQPFGPQTFGPQTFGPQTFGPQTFGPQPFGPQTFGPTPTPRSLAQIARDRGYDISGVQDNMGGMLMSTFSGVTIGTQTHGFNLGNSPSGHINAPGTRLSNPFTPSTPSNMQSMADPASEYPEEAVVNPIDAQVRPPPLTNEQMTVNIACRVCTEQRADTLFEPCMHVVVCHFCSRLLQDGARSRRREEHSHPGIPWNCPLCRRRIHRARRVYMG